MNFLALLGWGPSQSSTIAGELLSHNKNEIKSHEILSMDDLIGMFSLEGINRTPAVMNEAKLLWLNRHYFGEKLKDTDCLQQLAVQLKTQVCSVHE